MFTSIIFKGRLLLGSYSHSLGWPVTYFVDLAGFEFIATVQRKCNYRHESPALNKQYFINVTNYREKMKSVKQMELIHKTDI